MHNSSNSSIHALAQFIHVFRLYTFLNILRKLRLIQFGFIFFQCLTICSYMTSKYILSIDISIQTLVFLVITRKNACHYEEYLILHPKHPSELQKIMFPVVVLIRPISNKACIRSPWLLPWLTRLQSVSISFILTLVMASQGLYVRLDFFHDSHNYFFSKSP